jgi:hypothetical protein
MTNAKKCTILCAVWALVALALRVGRCFEAAPALLVKLLGHLRRGGAFLFSGFSSLFFSFSLGFKPKKSIRKV